MSRSHTFRVDRSIPGILLRVALVVLVAVGAFTVIPVEMWRWIAMAAAVGAMIVPRAMLAWVAAACLPIGMLMTSASPGTTALAILLVHAIHVLGGLSLAVPARSHLALTALVPSLRRFAMIQLIAQPVAFGAALVATGFAGGASAWLAPLGGALLLAGVGAGLYALRRVDL